LSLRAGLDSHRSILATALAVCACEQGRRVRFTTLAGLANELSEAESRRELARVVGRYARTELIVLDELGYLALPEGAAELVFQVISERNERGSVIVTTNLPFGEWTKVFPDPRLAKAVVDRITHKAHIIDTGTESAHPETSPPGPSARRARPPAPLGPTGLAPRVAEAHTSSSPLPTNKREVGPFQASALGPMQAAAPRNDRLRSLGPPIREGLRL